LGLGSRPKLQNLDEVFIPMKVVCWLVVLTCAPFWCLTAPAGDFGKVDRTPKKEPAYQSKAPKYCMLEFGPQAKTRVWLVLDGDTLYIDRNGNGDLTEKGECIKKKGALGQFMAGEVVDVDGKTKHTNVMVMHQTEDGLTITFVTAMVAGKHMFMAGIDSLGTLRFADRPQDAPIIHFGGELRMGLNAKFSKSEKEELVRSDKAEELYAWIGTPGLGKGTFAALMHKGIPAGVHPIAEIEFPNKEASAPPIRNRVILKKRC
jgi:hypothetical protein